MSSCQNCFHDFFSIYLQFLLGEMVNVLLLGVRSVRVVGIDQIDRIVDDSAGKRSAVDSEDGCHIYHADQSSTSSGCISMQLV